MGRFQAELIAIIKSYQLHFRFPQWNEILFMAEEGLYSESLFETLLSEARLDAQQIEDQGNFLWRPPTEEELYAEGKPDFEIGRLIEGEQQRLGIRFKDRPRNILIIGSAGMGKSITCKNICINLDKTNQLNPKNPTRLIIIDPKIDYPDLVNKLHGDVVHLSAHHNLRLGLNGPADVPPNVWIGTLSVSIAARLGLVMSRTCLASLIGRLLVALNPWLKKDQLNDPITNKELVWPSLKIILEAIKIKDVLECFSSKASYGETLIQALEGLIQDSGEIFNCSNGLDINRDIIQKKKHCIFEVPNLTAPVVRLITDIVINHVLVSRLYNNYKCDHTDVLYVVDEGDLLVEAERELAFPDGMSPGSKVNRLGRELGVGTIFLISGIQKVGEHIVRNAPYTFVFNLGDAESVYAACLHLQLDLRCQRMLGSLLPGQCIFRQTQASWNSAMWCEIDYVSPARNLGSMKYEPHQYIPAIPLSKTPHVLADLNAAVEEYKNAIKRQSSSKTPELDSHAIALLKLRARNPYAPVARLIEAIGKLRFDTQVAIRKFLEDNNLAEFEETRIGRSNLLLMDITNKGYETQGIPIPQENKGRGSISHRHFAHWIKFYYEQRGYKAYIEWVIPGTNHPVDIAVELENHLNAFEICITSFDNVVSHIKACFEEGQVVDSLTIVVATKTKLKELKKLLQSNLIFNMYVNKIKFDVIEKYVIRELKHESD
jgi:hypothetical protein